MLCPSKRLFVAAAILVFVAAAILVRSAVFIEGTNDSMKHTAAGGEMVPARESASLLPQLKRKQKNAQLRAAHTDEESAATRVFDTSPILARKRPLRFAVASVAIFDGGLSEDVKIALENHAACVTPTYLKKHGFVVVSSLWQRMQMLIVRAVCLRRYCKRHGYHRAVLQQPYSGFAESQGRPLRHKDMPWQKMLLVDRLMRNASLGLDGVFTVSLVLEGAVLSSASYLYLLNVLRFEWQIDTDAIFMNMSLPLDFMLHGEGSSEVLHPGIVFAPDTCLVNTGQVLYLHTAWTLRLLRTLWNMREPHKFWEQGAMVRPLIHSHSE